MQNVNLQHGLFVEFIGKRYADEGGCSRENNFFVKFLHCKHIFD